jgi:hypothetical protein
MTMVWYVVHRPEHQLFPLPVLSGPYFVVEEARYAAMVARQELVTIYGRLAQVDVAHVSVPEVRKTTKLAQVSPETLLDCKLAEWGQLPKCGGCLIGEPDSNEHEGCEFADSDAAHGWA